uniref:Cytoplasmic tRNA 2-thiolation protein 1 n=1 Tax=Paramoeba aestuarina TaxID=180227 RepID=A0A7S4P0L7_9EUKA
MLPLQEREIRMSKRIACVGCGGKAAVKRPKSGDPICRPCFYQVLEDEVHETIKKHKLFKKGEKVAIGASGGKDSTVLAELLTVLNKRHDYGLDLCLLSVDEGISGYRDDSLETVKLNQQSYQIPLLVVSYEQLYGWSMDKIVATIGRKSNCTFCGVFRRQALERGANLLQCDKLVTGHNADDVAETIIMNLLRGDSARLSRCVEIETKTGQGGIPRVRPFKFTYEKEIVLYAHFKRLDYFSTECSYAPGSFRGYARTYLKELERVKPTIILDVIHSGETIAFQKNTKMPKMRQCSRCGFLSSMELCKGDGGSNGGGGRGG